MATLRERLIEIEEKYIAVVDAAEDQRNADWDAVMEDTIIPTPKPEPEVQKASFEKAEDKKLAVELAKIYGAGY